jgi:hypothetical protein
LNEDGHFLAIEASLLDPMGAYNSVHGPFVTIRNTTNGLPLVNRTPAIAVDVQLVMTNTASTSPYRGAGREQAALITELLVNLTARDSGAIRWRYDGPISSWRCCFSWSSNDFSLHRSMDPTGRQHQSRFGYDFCGL